MKLTDELIDIARAVEGLKRGCGMGPESPTAIQNARYMGVSHRLRTLAAELEKQAVVVGVLYQHSETGRTQVLLSNAIADWGVGWQKVGDLILRSTTEEGEQCS